MKRLLAISALLALAGCNGTIREFADNPAYPTDARSTKGVRVYMATLMKVTSATTSYADPKTKTVTYACKPVQAYQIKAMADYTTPLRMYYDPGLFETVTFGVTLNQDGTLGAVNGNSTPAGAALLSSAGPVLSGVGAILAAAAPVAAAAPAAAPATAAGAPTPLCTGDPVVVRIEKCPPASGSTLCSVPTP
jgi:hypothetical protein